MATSVVFLRCLSGAGPLMLDGRTHNGTVGLAPHTGPPFSGTRWHRRERANGIWILECLGDLPGPRFLHGQTADGTVGLAPDDGPRGTQWRAMRQAGGGVALECLGDTQEPLFLRGLSVNGSVNLARAPDRLPAGALWAAEQPIDDGIVGVPADD